MIRFLFTVFLSSLLYSQGVLAADPDTAVAVGDTGVSKEKQAEKSVSGTQADKTPAAETVAEAAPAEESEEPRYPLAEKADQGKQSVSFESLAQINELIGVGVPALALNLIEQEQKKRRTYSPDWYGFEYKRILLLVALEQWDSLIKRTEWLFATAQPGRQITPKIRLWFETQQVMARLQLKQSERAIEQLQHMLWLTPEKLRNPAVSALWRRLVIRAYLQLKNDDDARKALIRYQLDYGEKDTGIDWMVLRAEVLLNTGRPQQAIELLQQLELEETQALIYLAQLQSDPQQAEQINQQMRLLMDGQLLSNEMRWSYSYVAYSASKLLKHLPAQIFNLEAMLSLGIESPVFYENYKVTADELWQLYEQRGLVVANDHGLLLGNDDLWQALADKLVTTAADDALAIHASLVMQKGSFEQNRQSHQAIVEILEQRKNGLELINQLYLHSKYADNVGVLPDEVRYRLVDYALSEGNYFEAATLMKTLQEPPAGKSLFDWRMRKARVLILQGGYQQSADLLLQTLSEMQSITADELDRYIQVVFDFQTVQQHDKALLLFSMIDYDGLSDELKREIAFWKAESNYSLKRYDRAALNYLQSAGAIAGAENDLWGQSARFKAGNALIKAGIYDDARRVYDDLLEITASDSRKAMIKQNLQKIRLLKSSDANKP